MNKAAFIKKYGRRKRSRFYLWVLRLFGSHHETKIEELRPKVASAYNDFIAQRGELFEDKIVPMDEAEISDITSRKRKTLSKITYVAFPLAALFIALSFAGGTPTLTDLGRVLLIVGVAGALYYLTKNNFDRVLSSQTKRVVTGVITDIIYTDEDGPAFEISFKEMVIVFTQQYKNCLPGDIVSIRIYSERETMMKRSINKIGNLFDYEASAVKI